MGRVNHPSSEPRHERILVVRNRYIGDTLLAIPFLRNLRRGFPDATIDVLVDPGSGSVLAECPYKDELVTWHRPTKVRGMLPKSLDNILDNAARLRARGYTRTYLLKRSFSSGLLVWLAGIPHRVGGDFQGRRPLLTRAVPIDRCRHEAEHFLDLLRDDGIAVDDGHNENWTSPAAAARVAEVTADLPAERPWVFIAPKATNANREWLLDRMAATADWLVQHRSCEICFCGAPRDIAAHEAIREMMQPAHRQHVHDFSRDLRLDETGAFLSKMQLYLGVDTGLAHLAASFNTPVVVLFGPSDPNQWHPWGTASEVVRGQNLRRNLGHRIQQWRSDRSQTPLRWPLGETSMSDIAVEQVTEAASRLLANPPPRALPLPKFRQRIRSPMPIGS
jgi:heptosyltransferase-2